jgi:CubicO group peptidase (beta-lactamase class C family)
MKIGHAKFSGTDVARLASAGMLRALMMTRRSASKLALGALVSTAAQARTTEPRFLPAGNLRAAAEYSAQRRGYSLLVIQHGKTLLEQYTNGSSAKEAQKIFSGTKGYWMLAALVAAEKGILRLNERVADTIDEWRTDKQKARITVRQLLDFSSGMSPLFPLHQDGISNRDEIAIRQPLVAEPGESFIYGPGSLQVFHALLKRKLAPRGESPTHYLEHNVLAPLGMGPQRYVADKSGNPLLAAGFKLTTQQWARMGRLVLNGGAPVVSTDSFAACCSGSSVNRAFSLGFWNNRAASRRAREFDIEDMLELKWQQQVWRNTCLCRDAPEDMIAAIGSSYNRLFVIPSMGLIVVRQSVNAKFSDGEFLRMLLNG